MSLLQYMHQDDQHFPKKFQLKKNDSQRIVVKAKNKGLRRCIPSCPKDACVILFNNVCIYILYINLQYHEVFWGSIEEYMFCAFPYRFKCSFIVWLDLILSSS